MGESKILKTELKVKKKTSMITNSKQGYLTKSLVVDKDALFENKKGRTNLSLPFPPLINHRFSSEL